MSPYSILSDALVRSYLKTFRRPKIAPFACPVPKCKHNFEWSNMEGVKYHLRHYKFHTISNVVVNSSRGGKIGKICKREPNRSRPISTRTPAISTTTTSSKIGSTTITDTISKNGRKRKASTKLLESSEDVVENESKSSTKEEMIEIIDIDGRKKMISIRKCDLIRITHAIGLLPPGKKVKPDPEATRIEGPEPKFTIIDGIEYAPLGRSTGRLLRSSTRSGYFDQTNDYDSDDLDLEWLKMANRLRRAKKLPPIAEDTFEGILDQFEKKCEFVKVKDGYSNPDEDRCAICSKSATTTRNVLVTCKHCNVTVHKQCYGWNVPKDETEWLCRRCQVSPSKSAVCIACPNAFGPFKEIDWKDQDMHGRWVHSICAVYIPELYASNLSLMEPIEGLRWVSASRRGKTCSICQEDGGICIECSKPKCSTPFHASCAQEAGLLCNNGSNVGKKSSTTAFCFNHRSSMVVKKSQSGPNPVAKGRVNIVKRSLPKIDQQEASLTAVRERLTEKNAAGQYLYEARISDVQLDELCDKYNFPEKEEFLRSSRAYWILKRRQNCGVPFGRLTV